MSYTSFVSACHHEFTRYCRRETLQELGYTCLPVSSYKPTIKLDEVETSRTVSPCSYTYTHILIPAIAYFCLVTLAAALNIPMSSRLFPLNGALDVISACMDACLSRNVYAWSCARAWYERRRRSNRKRECRSWYIFWVKGYAHIVCRSGGKKGSSLVSFFVRSIA